MVRFDWIGTSLKRWDVCSESAESNGLGGFPAGPNDDVRSIFEKVGRVAALAVKGPLSAVESAGNTLPRETKETCVPPPEPSTPTLTPHRQTSVDLLRRLVR